MNCDTCDAPMDPKGFSTSCPECRRIVVSNAFPDDDEEEVEDESDEERCDVREEYMSCRGCDQPDDEDLVTKDYVTFFRFNMGLTAFQVPNGREWRDAAQRYMEETEYWPNVWLEEERGGYMLITTEGP